METHITKAMIREWFILRFAKKPENDAAYFDEWLHRFYTEENAWRCMDNESQRDWNTIRRMHGFLPFEVL